ncbi:hypothetical protein SAMN05443633_105174 [Chryseobacterium arachidis]|uniref:Uncharacterized protein n=1 Tax=Chryseobacterium arachidis TaxID=1416778 RepID=A0A1M5D719_9FLAO|nr:hypothetical protein SAMN05443633_105174 [Chryseobacterium arachidis]
MKQRKNRINFIINILIWLYTIIIAYIFINGGYEKNILLFSGISIGSLLTVNLVYLKKKLFFKEIISIIVNIISIILIIYLTSVFIQLDVR